MSYDILGDDFVYGDDEFDDEFEGAIGEDDDDEVLEALVEGAGDMEIVGAKRSKASRAKMLRALKGRIARKRASLVMKRGLETKRRYPLGIVPTSIGAGATVQVPSAPQALFRPERLVIPSDIAFDFGIADIKVGNTSQLVQAAEVPGAIFTEVSIDTDVTFDTAEIGNQVSVNARNKSGGAIEFTAALLGTIAKR